MFIENFFTSQITGGQTGTNNSTGGPALSNRQSATKGLAKNGEGFMELILMHLSEAKDQEDLEARLQKVKTHQALKSESPVMAEDPQFDVASMLAANPEIEEEIRRLAETFSLDLNQQIAHVLTLNQQAFTEDLKALSKSEILAALRTDNTQADQKAPNLFEALMLMQHKNPASDMGELKPDLEQILARLKELAENDRGALIAAGFTPAQIAELQQKTAIHFQPASQVQAGNNIAPENKGENIGEIKPGSKNVKQQGEETSRDPAAALSALLVSLVPAKAQTGPGNLTATKDTGETKTSSLLKRLEAVLNTQISANDGLSRLSPANYSGQPKFSFDDLLKQFEGRTPNVKNLETALTNSAKAMMEGFKDQIQQQAGHSGSEARLPMAPLASYLQNWPLGSSGQLYSAFDWSEAPLNDYGLHTAGMTSGTQGSFSSLVTQAQSAGQAHPATAMIAANIRKGASTGNTRSMTLHLEPPEMGRVEIRMDISSKDKTMRATIIAEKPETVLLLQRDAHNLERALQDIGLDAESGLNFELADDGQGFSHDGSHDGHNGGGRGGGEQADSGEEIEIIESTMTWHVDPETGHMHYSILA